MAIGSKFHLRILLWVAAAVLLLLLGLQLVRPALENQPVTAEFEAPPEVKQILRNSCYNCHSNETRLAWFDRIVPAYWLVASDVRQARSRLNFSEIGAQPAAAQRGVLFEAVNQIQLGAMPLPSYLLAHPEAAVTRDQLTALRACLSATTPPPASAPATAAAEPPRVRAALNGVEFIPDYKNWKTISATDRFDNGSIRAILGNDVAIEAISSHRINPWPDGATFAKVAWQQQPGEKGFIRTGAFVQVEFMIKDSKKYAATKGWGWGRWRGADLKPYGTSPAFTNECVGCHTPVRANDYVYTSPIPSAPVKGQS